VIQINFNLIFDSPKANPLMAFVFEIDFDLKLQRFFKKNTKKYAN